MDNGHFEQRSFWYFITVILVATRFLRNFPIIMKSSYLGYLRRNFHFSCYIIDSKELQVGKLVIFKHIWDFFSNKFTIGIVDPWMIYLSEKKQISPQTPLIWLFHNHWWIPQEKFYCFQLSFLIIFFDGNTVYSWQGLIINLHKFSEV